MAFGSGFRRGPGSLGLAGPSRHNAVCKRSCLPLAGSAAAEEVAVMARRELPFTRALIGDLLLDLE